MSGSRIRAEDQFSESSPLLANGGEPYADEARARAPTHWNPWAGHFRKRAAYLIIPVLFGINFVSVITTTPTVQIFEQIVCRWWFAAHDPESLPSDGSPPSDEQCKVEGVVQAFSALVTINVIANALGGVISAGIVNYFAIRYGRKPVLLVLVTFKAIGTACFLGAAEMELGTPQNGLLVAWLAISALSSMVALSLTCNMYIVDMTHPSDRTSVLSVTAGFAMLGMAPTYWLGGFISSHSGIVAVFWWKLSTVVLIILYVLLFLPESFSAEKREAARRKTLQRSAKPPRSNSKLISLFRRPLDSVDSVFEPLKHLKPSHNSITGQRNFRFLLIATSQAFTNLGSDYVGTAFLIIATTRLQFKSEELGAVLTLSALSQVIWLAVILPAILRWGKPLYDERWPSQRHITQNATNINPNEAEVATRDVGPHDASGFDVYIAIASSFGLALAVIFIALARSPAAIFGAVVLLCIGVCYDPAIKSVAAASVDPLHAGEALSALAIVTSVGAFLAPIIFGAILSSTITTIPELMFFICSAMIVIGAVLLLFVRDSDQHFKTQGDEK